MMQVLFYLPLKKALKDARTKAGLRQSDIAKQARLSIPTVRALEQGQGTLESLDPVLACLNLEICGARLPRNDGHLGRSLFGLRRALGISRQDLAEQIGVSTRTLATLETEWRGRVETLDAALAVLDGGAYLAPIGSRHEAVTNDPKFRPAASVMNPLQSLLGRFDLSPCPAEISGRVLPVQASKQFAEEDDPLHLPWKGKVILNPPYTDDLPKWVCKAFEEFERGTAKLVAALLPAFTDRPWWHMYVARKATVVFLRGLVSFEDDDPRTMPSALVIWGATDDLIDKIEQAYPESWVIRPGG